MGTHFVPSLFSVVPQKIDEKKANKGAALIDPAKEGAPLPFG